MVRIADRVPKKLEAFLEGKERLFLIVVRHGHDYFIEEFSGAIDHIEMTIRHRVEAAGINRASDHGGTFNAERVRSKRPPMTVAERAQSSQNTHVKMIDPPYRTVAVASTFSPRFLQVIAEGKRIRDRLCRQMHLIYVGKCDEETTRKFGEAFLQLKLPSESTIHYQEGDPAVAILAVAAANEIDLLVAGALEKEAVLRPFLGNVARRPSRIGSASYGPPDYQDIGPRIPRFGGTHHTPLVARFGPGGANAWDHQQEIRAEKLFVIRVYTSFDEARAKARSSAGEVAGSELPRTLEEEEAALEEFIDSAGETDVPIEARCIRGNTGYAALDFVQAVEAMLLVVPVDPQQSADGLPPHVSWVTDVIPCNLWVIR